MRGNIERYGVEPGSAASLQRRASRPSRWPRRSPRSRATYTPAVTWSTRTGSTTPAVRDQVTITKIGSHARLDFSGPRNSADEHQLRHVRHADRRGYAPEVHARPDAPFNSGAVYRSASTSSCRPAP
ncbi:hypothetical protein HBB16_08250 [Pseudonocardia sp. MCCB 268]|nr:hypothetical protein [Pseudonocardia cytotoxica]